MKYIRTKDGRILESEINDNRKSLGYELIPFIKQTDTIEELCDGFIIGETLKIYNKSNFNFEKKIVNLGHKEYYKFENLKSIYGVIMTFENSVPKIITVAKMNEKGELELL